MLGEALGIRTTDSAELVQKLTEFHVKDIIAASNEIMESQVTCFDKGESKKMVWKWKMVAGYLEVSPKRKTIIENEYKRVNTIAIELT